MTDVRIYSKDESLVKIDCEPSILQEISERYTFAVPNAKFMPAYQAGQWDGKIRLVSYMERTAPKGLVPSIASFCREENYKVGFDQSFRRFKESFDVDYDSYKLPFTPHDHQKEAIEHCLAKKRALLLSATSSGKSLMLYIMSRMLIDKKVIIITPRVSLVTQLYSDFEEYSENNEFDVESNVHKIYSGQDKVTDKPITITTWQSVYKMPKKFFEQFDVVMADEVHEFEAKSCSSIMSKATNAFYRFGFTGTLEDSKTHELSLIGMFGPIKRVSDTADLMEKGIVTDMEVRAFILKYGKDESNEVKKLNYKDEVDYIIAHKKRNNLIKEIARRSKGNSLVLVRYVEKHGQVLYDMMNEDLDGKEVYFVHGGTDVDMREHIRKLMEKKSNIVVIASIQIFSTGINIKNLAHVILGHPTKSKIKILQSIGRGLRKHKDKDIFYFWDIADDFRGTRKTPNSTLKHFMYRYELYKKEKFKVRVIQKEI